MRSRRPLVLSAGGNTILFRLLTKPLFCSFPPLDAHKGFQWRFLIRKEGGFGGAQGIEQNKNFVQFRGGEKQDFPQEGFQSASLALWTQAGLSLFIKPLAAAHAISEHASLKGGDSMNWIPCTSCCVYQRDGLCQLDCAAAAGLPHQDGGCVHFIPDGTPRAAHPRCSPPGSASDPREPGALNNGTSE